MRLASLIVAIFLAFAATLLPFTLHAEDSPEIAALLKGMSNPYWKSLNDGIVDKAKELAVPLYVQGISSDSDSEAQLNMCQTMLLRNPKAMIVAPVNGINLAPCLQKAADAGIQLVDVDGNFREAESAKARVKIAFSVASDNYQLGALAAKYLHGESGKVLLIEGFSGSSNARLRAKGFEENLPYGLHIIASLPGNWDRLRAADITNTTITQHPDLRAIFCANDLMALGAAEAVLSHGKNDIKVIGIDGIADAVKAIEGGRMAASVAQLPYLMGQEAVEKTHRLVKGEAKYEFNQVVPVFALDRQVLIHKTEPLLKFLR